jgi:hypothetical protein
MSDNMTEKSSSDDVHPISKLLFGWTEAKATPTLFMAGIGLICFVLLGLDFVVERHAYKPISFSTTPTFYAFYGFCAFAFVVLCGWPLGKLLHRDENYYGDQEDPSDNQQENS